MLQHLDVSLLLWHPKLNLVLKVWPQQCQAKGDNQLSNPTGHAVPNAGQDTLGLLGHLSTPQAHVQLVVNQHPQVLFCGVASRNSPLSL